MLADYPHLRLTADPRSATVCLMAYHSASEMYTQIFQIWVQGTDARFDTSQEALMEFALDVAAQHRLNSISEKRACAEPADGGAPQSVLPSSP